MFTTTIETAKTPLFCNQHPHRCSLSVTPVLGNPMPRKSDVLHKYCMHGVQSETVCKALIYIIFLKSLHKRVLKETFKRDEGLWLMDSQHSVHGHSVRHNITVEEEAKGSLMVVESRKTQMTGQTIPNSSN